MVWTQPDRPTGRGRKMRPSTVKQVAEDNRIAVYQPTDLNTVQACSKLAEARPDLLVVVAYGRLIPQGLLDVPRLGAINVHASLLPKWRGAAPIQHAILAGDQETGVTLMQMDDRLDTGEMLLQVPCVIRPDDTADTLHERLARLGAQTLLTGLAALHSGSVNRTPQDDTRATYAPRLHKRAALIDWTERADAIERRIRAFNPWPVAHTTLDGMVLRLWKAKVLPCREPPAAPGSVVRASKAGIDVASGVGILRVLEVQLPGARRVATADFLNAYRLSPKTRLGVHNNPLSDE